MGGKRRGVLLAALVGAVVAFALGYLYWYGFRAPGEAVKPEVVGVELSWGGVNDSVTEVLARVVVYNPNPFQIEVKRVTFDLYMNGLRVGSGECGGYALAGRGNTTITLRGFLDNEKIPEWFVSHVSRGERTEIRVSGVAVIDLKLAEASYPFDKEFTFKTDLLSGLNVTEPQEVSLGPLVLFLKELETRWGSVGPEGVEVNHKLVLFNPQPLPIPLPVIEYKVYVNGVEVGEGSTRRIVVMSPGKDTVLLFTTSLNPRALIRWWVTHIRNGERTRLVVEAYSTVEVAGEKYSFEVYRLEKLIETNILGGLRP